MKRFYLIQENHRYKLKYQWDEEKPLVLFIMLNPSYLRNEGELSPTSQKVISWAKDNGYGGVWIGNLFSYISANPYKLITTTENTVGKDNDICLRQMANECEEIIFAWGKFPFAHKRAEEIKRMFPEGKSIGNNLDGSPAHPLSNNFKFAI